MSIRASRSSPRIERSRIVRTSLALAAAWLVTVALEAGAASLLWAFHWNFTGEIVDTPRPPLSDHVFWGAITATLLFVVVLLVQRLFRRWRLDLIVLASFVGVRGLVSGSLSLISLAVWGPAPDTPNDFYLAATKDLALSIAFGITAAAVVRAICGRPRPSGADSVAAHFD